MKKTLLTAGIILAAYLPSFETAIIKTSAVIQT